MECSYCHETTEVKHCAACKLVYYCDISCQKRDWKYHKYYCRILNTVLTKASEENREDEVG